MLILGVDTAGRTGSVALLRAEAAAAGKPEKLETLGLLRIEGGKYLERLLGEIAGLLESSRLDKGALELIAVNAGPGSFTGLRVALATTKGLAEALGVPVAAVSALEALALESKETEGRVVALMDAQRGELFRGDYRLTRCSAGSFSSADAARQAICESEKLTTLAALLESLAAEPASESGQAPELVTSDPKLAEKLRDTAVECQLVRTADAGDFARLGWRKWLAGGGEDLARLDANYLRRSDAEIFSAPRLGIAPQ